MNFNTPNMQLPQLYAFIILQYFLLRFFLTWSSDSELCVQRWEPASAHAHLGLEALAGNPAGLSEAVELPPYLADNLI